MFSRLNSANETPSKKAIPLSPGPKSSPEDFSTERTEAPHSPGPAYSLERLRIFANGEGEEPESRAGRQPMRLAWPMQAKLEVGAVDDPLESEADRVAEQVLHTSTSAAPAPATTPAISRVQRKCSCGGSGSECEACKQEREKEEKPLRRKAAGAPATGAVPASVHEVLRSPGHPLDAATRAFFEPRFGHDFSHVRVHLDTKAAQSARAVQALAYTVGQDVVFDSGRYAPHTSNGRRLLGHELTHVIQQAGLESASRELRIGGEQNAVEKEATAETASLPQSGSGAGRASGMLQRQQKPNPQSAPHWGPDAIYAGVWNRSGHCGAGSNARGMSSWGVTGGGPVAGSYKGHCRDLCANQPLPLRLDFLVDGFDRPRPGVKQGDKLSRLVANVKFIPSGGQETTLVQGTGDGTYDQVAYSLTTSFRTDLSNFTLSGPGKLQVSLINDDIGGQGVAAYADEIDVVDCPGVRGPGITVPRSAIQTGRWLSCPDPERPQLCYPANWNSPPPLYEIEQDETGRFYRYKGRKMYLREEGEKPHTVQPTPESGSMLRRKCAECEGEEKLQRKGAGSPGSEVEAPPIVHEVLNSPGQPLDAATRAFFEPRFRHDFSRVRIHTDARAAESAAAVNALAYTVGSDVVFGVGEPISTTGQSRGLLAHELAHTIQQGGTRPASQKLQPADVSDFARPRPASSSPRITTSPCTFVARQKSPDVPAPGPTGGAWANCPAKEIAKLDHELAEAVSWVQKGVEDLQKKELSATTRGALGRYLTTDSAIISSTILPLLTAALAELKKGAGNFQCQSQAACVKMNPTAADAMALASYPITLCEGYFPESSLERTSTLIHECLHHAGLISDIYEFKWPFPGLSENERLKNEDSYVAFVRSNSIPMLPPLAAGPAGGQAVQVGGGVIFPGGGGAPRYVVSAEWDAPLRQRMFRFLDLSLGYRFDVDSSGTVLETLSVGARAFAPVSVSKVPLFIDLRTGVVGGFGGPAKNPEAVLTTLGVPAEVRAGVWSGHFGASLDYRHVFNLMKNNPDLNEVVLSGELRF